jgi:thioredoxin 1
MIYINNEGELKLSGLSVVKFYSETCKPCKRLDTVLTKMEKEFPHMVFYSVDINNCIELTKKYQIRSVPTLIMFKEKTQISTMVGLYNTDQIRQEFKKFTDKQ